MIKNLSGKIIQLIVGREMSRRKEKCSVSRKVSYGRMRSHMTLAVDLYRYGYAGAKVTTPAVKLMTKMIVLGVVPLSSRLG